MKHIGLYVHVPFCASRCPYCDFYTERAGESVRSDFISALKRDVLAWSEKDDFCADTVYFGGGTPSVLPGDALAEILRLIKDRFHVPDSAEITVECNPSSDLETFLPAVTAAGVNRISLGMQSAVDNERKLLGRKADRKRVEECIALARRCGEDNISLDIMLGVPEQTEESLEETLQFCIDTGVPHLSSYMLKLEEGTNFYKRRDKLELPSEDTTVGFYEKTAAVLKAAGYQHYEISNFAKPGYEGRHNLKYWRCGEYLGLGPAAHSYLDGKRFYTEPDLTAYLDKEMISDEGTGGDFEERLMLALRLSEGFSEELPSTVMEELKKPYMAKYTNYDGKTLRLTEEGFLVSNSVISQLLASLNN